MPRHVAPSWACCCGVLDLMRPRGLSGTESEAGVILPVQDVFLHHVVAPCASAWRLTPPPQPLPHNPLDGTRWKKKKKCCSTCKKCASLPCFVCVCACVWRDKAGKWIPFPEPIKAGAPQADKWWIGDASSLSQSAMKEIADHIWHYCEDTVVLNKHGRRGIQGKDSV